MEKKAQIELCEKKLEVNVSVGETKGKNEQKKLMTFYNSVSLFFWVRKFISNLQSFTFNKRLKYLNESQIKLIGDNSFDFAAYKGEKKQVKSNLVSRKTILNRFLSKLHINVFNPFSIYMLIWDFINILLFIFFYVIFPIDICFWVDLVNFKTLRVFIVIFHALDIVFNFNTAYLRNGQLIQDRSQIYSYYLKNYFIFDQIGFILILVWSLNIIDFTENSGVQVLFLFYFMKIPKILNILHKFETKIITNETVLNWLSLYYLFCQFIAIIHIEACFWHFVAYNDNMRSDNTWLSSRNLLNENWETRYLNSFYYTLILMSTIGYGDIVPKNSIEILVCILFTFIGLFTFASVIYRIGIILKDLSKYQKESRREIFLMKKFMNSENVTFSMRIRVETCLEEMRTEEMRYNKAEVQNVINKLPHNLASELIVETNCNLMRNIGCLNLNFSQKTLRKMVFIMKEEIYNKGDIIFERGNVDNNDLFIIKKGCVEIFVENHILKELKKSESFGELAFFTNFARTAGAVCKTFTILVRIDQNSFKKIVEENNSDNERFHHIKDSLNIYKKYECLSICCYSCKDQNHMISECPSLHKKFYKEMILAKHIFTKNQERNPDFLRKPKRKKFTMKCILGGVKKLLKIDEKDFDESGSRSENSIVVSKKNSFVVSKKNSFIYSEGEEENCDIFEKSRELNLKDIDYDFNLDCDSQKCFKNYFPNNNFNMRKYMHLQLTYVNSKEK